MEPISKIQNEKLQLQRLAAQRQMYDEARRFKVYRMILTVPVAICWAILSTFLIGNGIITLIGGLIIVLIDIFTLSNIEKFIHEKAAKTQELFDCDVLQMDWNYDSIGNPPTPDDIVEFASRYDPKRYPNSPLDNWYSNKVDKLPIHLGRIVCQKSNLSWDAKLRRRYVKAITIYLGLLTFLIICGGFIFSQIQLSGYTFIIASLGPIFIFSIREIKNNLESAKSLDKLKEKMDILWHEAFIGKAQKEELVRASRNWQNDIYNHRKNSPVIPKQLYEKYRDPDETKMHRSSDALVEDALRHLKK